MDIVKFDEKGLIYTIAQDWQTHHMLIVTWMNTEALQKTVETGFAHYYSRSYQRQWMKGEESGHTQKVHELHLDCDGDAVVVLIKQNGGIAYHTGRESCFYEVWQEGAWQAVDAVLKDEEAICGRKHP